MSIDVFRGATIAGMILVNDPGSWANTYWPLLHAKWDGWTPTDLVFPFFLFIVGVSIVFSFQSRISRGATRRELLLHTVRRSALIFAIGLGLASIRLIWSFDLSKVRIPGVLQRIAVCYLIASAIYLFNGVRARIAITAGILIAYWAALRFIPVPGFGAGDLTPVGNVGAFIDRLIFNTHLYRPSWDPEGLLSSVPAVATVLLGIFAGEWLRTSRSEQKKVVAFLIAGIIGIVAGELLHPYFPINKSLWTSSYVLLSAGFASLSLGVLHWITDVRLWRRWSLPLNVFGSNAILSYTLSGIFGISMVHIKVAGSALQELAYSAFLAIASPKMASLLYAITFVGVMLAIMTIFYRKKIFLKV